jgi:hypothetical protein
MGSITVHTRHARSYVSARTFAEISFTIVMLITLAGHGFTDTSRSAQKQHKISAR